MHGNNICVIGGAGFLGSHLVNYLIENNNNVIVLDNLISGKKEFINEKANFIWCDITQSEHNLYKIFKNNKIEYVFNYAAEPYVPVSYDRPLHVFDINARGALMVLNAAQDAGVKRILQVSSAEIYGDINGLIDEKSEVRPHSTYGAAKLAIDAMIQTRWKESQCPAISLRQFNCIGERDVLHPYVLPEIYRQAKKSTIVQLGNNTYRDFMYAGDAVKMAVELLEKGNLGEVYNLGSETGIKIYDLAELVGKIINKPVKVVEETSRKRAWEIWVLQSNNKKIYSVIKTRPAVDLETAVKKTIQYYEAEGF